MDDRQDLLMEWLEGEGTRQSLPISHLSLARDPSPRALVHLLVCLLAGGITAGIFVCWLASAWEQQARVTVVNQLRLEGMRTLVGDPNQPAWWKQQPPPTQDPEADYWIGLCLWGGIIAGKTLIGALVLCAAGGLYNGMAQGTTRRVPAMVLGKAVAVAFLAVLINSELGGGIRAALAGFLVLAALISVFLPTTFVRGVLIALCYVLVTIGLIALIVGVVGGAMMVHGQIR